VAPGDGNPPASRTWFYLDDMLNEPEVIRPVTWSTYVDEFIHDDTVALFGMLLVLFFCQISVETNATHIIQTIWLYQL
jgi:hypothetical protein